MRLTGDGALPRRFWTGSSPGPWKRACLFRALAPSYRDAYLCGLSQDLQFAREGGMKTTTARYFRRFAIGGVRGLAAHASVGVVSGIFNLGLMVSLASLIFLPYSPQYFASALGFFLLGASASAIVTALLASYPGTVATVQDVPAVVCAIMAGAIASAMATSSEFSIYSNIFVAVGISTITTGLALLLMGVFRLGHLVRFLPHPVIGGFLAGTGWLLVKGGIGVTTGASLDILHLGAYLETVNTWQLLACMGLGFMFYGCTRFFGNPLLLPLTLLVSIAVFHLAALVLGWTMTYMEGTGWLLGPLPDSPLYEALVWPDLGAVEWSLITGQAGSISAIVLLNVISVLLYVSGLEIIVRRDLDINLDMKGTGVSNILVGLLGAPSPFVTASETALGVRMKAPYSWCGIIAGLFLFLVFLVGGGFLSFFPKFAAGALLFFLGFAFLVEWVVDARKTLPLADYAIVLAILLCVEVFDFLTAIGVGLAASVVIFTVRYSLVNPVRRELDGSTFRSAKDRAVALERVLDHHAHATLLYQLQGYLFFGTANTIYEKLKTRMDQGSKAPTYVILDLRLTNGADGSALRGLEKLVLLLERNQGMLLISHAGRSMQRIFHAGGLTHDAYPNLLYFPDLDRAVEWCEDQVIAQAQARMQNNTSDSCEPDAFFESICEDVEAALKQQELFENVVERLEPYLTEVPLAEGQVLFEQDDKNTDLYFIMRGQVTLSLDTGRTKLVRARSLGPWTLAGELGFFLGFHSQHTATVDAEGMAYVLSKEQLSRLEYEAPKLAHDFQKLVIRLLGRQLAQSGATMRPDG
ncbi:MAG: STAS domain-containing protein [Desulfovibrio sp.]|nr:MAG: STAS domain-containing protein [Desulfovibrio sp.]